MSSSFSQHLMRYYFSCDGCAVYWMCLTVRKMKPCLKFLERSGGKSPLPLCALTLNHEQSGFCFPIDSLLYIAPTSSGFPWVLDLQGLRWTHSRAHKGAPRHISQCLHPTVSHPKRISMGHISINHQGLLEVRGWTTGCLKFLICKSAIWYQHH